MRDGGTNSVVIRNNTIYGGNGSTSSRGIQFTSSTAPIVDNNLIFTDTATGYYSQCLSEWVSTSLTIRNNDLFSCTVAYLDKDAACTTNEDGDNDATTCTLNEMASLADTALAGGNVSVDPILVNLNGSDNDATTANDNDWHFSGSSPLSVTAGGLNGIDDGGWGFTDDKDGITRPGSGSAWSIGAYEP